MGRGRNAGKVPVPLSNFKVYFKVSRGIGVCFHFLPEA
jgi:hypothetical protein